MILAVKSQEACIETRLKAISLSVCILDDRCCLDCIECPNKWFVIK